MTPMNNPRSTLHALVPMGQGTGDIESLASYFCRLAHSHSMTARNLAAWVLTHYEHPIPDDYKWFRRSFSGMSQEAEQWAVWLAELTGVPHLDQLTLSPWRHLMAGSGLTPVSDRWCPCCLAEDRAGQKAPYLRLVWDLAPATVCARHKVELVSTCPHCNKSNVRNRAAAVVPGFCTACGGFLGDVDAIPATPEAIWVARQLGQMLSTPPRVAAEGVAMLLETVIERMADGNVAAFAKRLGLSKSGVWYWVRKGGLPTLPAWLAISLHGGIGMEQLYSGTLSGWQPPREPLQLSMPLLASPRKGIPSRVLDWDAIRTQLRELLKEEPPVPLAEACERVGVSHTRLYMNATVETRAIADRFRRYRAEVRESRESRLQAQIIELVQERFEAGYVGISAREMWPSLPSDLKSVRNSFSLVAKAVADDDDLK